MVEVRWYAMASLILTLGMYFAVPGPALAHGFGQRQDIPLPFWLYLFGINAVVLATFVMIALSFDETQAARRYPRVDLLRVRPLRAVLTSRLLLSGVRIISVGLFLLVVLSGLFGEQTPEHNFAPTFVWVVWWVGMGFFTAFVGNIWPLVNPWKILFEKADGLARRLGARAGLELREPYAGVWGIWPALALYVLFIWVENVFEGASTPYNIAVLVLLYSAVTWAGMVLFGKSVWLQKGEVFSVFFGILARFAPTEVRITDTRLCESCGSACRPGKGECVNCYECFARAAPEARELDLRPPAVSLGTTQGTAPDYLLFVILMLASVTYDSLQQTQAWAGLRDPFPLSPTLELFVLPLIFLALYVGFMKLGQIAGKGRVPFGRLATSYVYSLVPIAIAYQAAHYYTYLPSQGQAIVALVSDPLGRGWNLFGTVGYVMHDGFLDAAFVWYSQVVLIVAGHIVAVYLAHVVALRLYADPGRAARSQFPILVLMIFYTVFSLWILTQPVAG
jgi:hypothetical protein